MYPVPRSEYRSQDLRQHRQLLQIGRSSLSFELPMQKRWKFFLKTIKDDTLDFSVVFTEIQTFLEPVFDAMVKEDEW